MGKLLNNKKLNVTSPKKVMINNLEIGGNKVKGGELGNSTVRFSANELIVKNANVKDLEYCYNIFEHAYSVETRALKNVVFDGCKFNSANIKHNVLSIYCFENNATITFRNCEFIDLDSNCNPVRFDNLKEAHNIVVTFDNCKWRYASVDGNATWLALVLLQPDAASLYQLPIMADWKVIVKNCEYAGNLIKPEDFEDYAHLTTKYQTNDMDVTKANSILYYYNKRLADPTVDEDKKFFPVVKIVAGNAAKEFKA